MSLDCHTSSSLEEAVKDLLVVSASLTRQVRAAVLHLSCLSCCIYWVHLSHPSVPVYTTSLHLIYLEHFQHLFDVYFSPPLPLQILLDANSIHLGSLPLGIYAASSSQALRDQSAYEVCVCPSGKIYLSPAESVSSCQAVSNICLWSWRGSRTWMPRGSPHCDPR